MCPWVEPLLPSFKQQLWGAAQPFGGSLTTGGNPPTSLQYNRLTPAA